MAKTILRVADRVILVGSGLRADLIGRTGTIIGFYHTQQNVLLVRVAPDDNPNSVVTLPSEFVKHNPVDAAFRQRAKSLPPPRLPMDWAIKVSWDSVGWKPDLKRYAVAVSSQLEQLRIHRVRRLK